MTTSTHASVSPALRATIAAHARDRGVTSALDVASVREIARDIGVDDETVERTLRDLFAGPSSSTLRDLTPVAHMKATASSSKPHELRVRSQRNDATHETLKRWDPIALLPADVQARMTPGDVRLVKAAMARLQDAIVEEKLSFIPVFGYLSLRTNNHVELGKQSQDDVTDDDVISATLPGYDIDVVASSVHRGTPEHPGAAAGLGRKEGRTTPGVVLKVPLERAEELLAVLLAREMFAEADLRDQPDGTSNAMYAPILERVTLHSGRQIPALVFATNKRGDKSVDKGDPYGDGAGLTVERLAYLFAGQGGFVQDGRELGGTSYDYWQASYIEARKRAHQPIDPKIAAAIELSTLYPQDDVVDRILARTDRDARLMQEALAHLFAGVAVPRVIHDAQKANNEGIERTPRGDRGDVEKKLLAKAKELELAGKISVD